MNGEALQAKPYPHGLSYLETADRRTVLGPGLRLSFSWTGDRWSHALEVGGQAPVEVARSVESDAQRDDPARVVSPAYQEIREHPFAEGVRVLLTGQATPHHFSAVVTVRREENGVMVEFDIADRCREPVAALGSTYLVPLGSSDLVDGTPGRAAWSGEALGDGRLEFTAEGCGTLSLAEAGRRASRVQALASIDPTVRTHRLLYRWRWSPPAPRSAAGVS